MAIEPHLASQLKSAYAQKAGPIQSSTIRDYLAGNYSWGEDSPVRIRHSLTVPRNPAGNKHSEISAELYRAHLFQLFICLENRLGFSDKDLAYPGNMFF